VAGSIITVVLLAGKLSSKAAHATHREIPEYMSPGEVETTMRVASKLKLTR
jgi:hypothetical protein